MVIIIIEYKLCGYIVNGWKKGKKIRLMKNGWKLIKCKKYFSVN